MNNRIIIYIIAALGVGLVVGYFLAPAVKSDGQTPSESATPAKEETIWTCSMHPQIRQNEPGHCPICKMDLIPLEENQSDDPLVLEMTREAVKLSNIQTSEATTGEKATQTLTLEGKVREDERLTVSQTAHVPGRIEHLFVTFTGEKVNKGQRLARIYSPPLITAQREYLEAKKFTEVSPDLLAATRQKLKRWKIPGDWIEQLDTTGEIQETVTVYAESSGTVTERYVAMGNYVSEGDPLFDLIDLKRLWVIFEAYESDLGLIDEGDEVLFTVRALPDETFTARVEYIDPVIDPRTRTADIRATVRNRGGKLKPGMFTEGQLLTDSPGEDRLVMIPRSAVLWTGPRSVVYVKLPDREIPSFEYREVRLGDRIGDQYQILSGIKPNEKVVTHGAFVVDAAAQLNNQKSMMNRYVQVKGSGRSVHDLTSAGDAAFRDRLVALTKAYLNVKDALVLSDAQSGKHHAKLMLAKLKEIPAGSLDGAADIFWEESRKTIAEHLSSIVAAVDVEQQRSHFAVVSDIFIEIIQAFGAVSEKLYVQHCPMALDDNGANWLSLEEEIRNPYFGDKMLKCGIVQDTFMKK